MGFCYGSNQEIIGPDYLASAGKVCPNQAIAVRADIVKGNGNKRRKKPLKDSQVFGDMGAVSGSI